jgi:hypothetical protein
VSGLTDGVSELGFEALGARVEPYAAQPTVVLRLRVTESSGTPVHAIALKCQIRIEPQRRTYEPAEEARLYDVFGPTPQWGDSLRPFLWTHTSAMVLAFTGSTEVDLPIVCSYDMEVAGHKYLHALDGGEVGLQLLFSGTVFAGATGFSARPVSWSADATFRLPVQVWREAMDVYFPNAAWVRMSRSAFDALSRYRSEHALPDWDLTVERLLKEADR